jgi:hypothetical protein
MLKKSLILTRKGGVIMKRILLLAVMALSCLVGCGEDGNPNNGGGDNSLVGDWLQKSEMNCDGDYYDIYRVDRKRVISFNSSGEWVRTDFRFDEEMGTWGERKRFARWRASGSTIYIAQDFDDRESIEEATYKVSAIQLIVKSWCDEGGYWENTYTKTNLNNIRRNLGL